MINWVERAKLTVPNTLEYVSYEYEFAICNDQEELIGIFSLP
jgi:hypothetical protein